MIEQLPNAVELERQVLGMVLMDPSIFGEVSTLEPSSFYDTNHQKAYRGMRNLVAKNEPINPFTLFEEVKGMNGRASIAEITQWTHGLPFLMQPAPLLSILKDKALKREIIRKCDALSRQAAEEEEIGTKIASEAVTMFQDAYTSSIDGEQPTCSLEEALPYSLDRWERMLKKEIVTVEVGIKSIDSQLTGGGLEKGMFHVIGARPGKGKTSLALDMATHNFLNGKVVVFFTMELSRDVLMDRLIAPLAGVERWKITSKWMSEYERTRLVAVSEGIKQLPFYINHKARTVSDMRLALREISQKTGGKIDLVLVDFLTKMRLGRGSKYESVSANVNGLAEFAPEFGCASVALAQLSRAVTKRASDEPGRIELTDFRDSGEIEELGRTMFGLWGDDDTTGQRHRTVTCSCLKQGEGRLFDEPLIFDTHFMTFGVRECLIQPAALVEQAA